MLLVQWVEIYVDSMFYFDNPWTEWKGYEYFIKNSRVYGISF